MICKALQDGGYFVGAVIIDAALFVPQSRPRLFVVCTRDKASIPRRCKSDSPKAPWHTRIVGPYGQLPIDAQHNWIWWNLPIPAKRTSTFADLIEENPSDVEWFTREQTAELVARMSVINRAKLQKAKRENRPVVGGLYRRTREDEDGQKVQRSEVRFDDVSGCLRTPAGGSSRQVIVIVDGTSVRARLISGRETARLMGLPDRYELPAKYNETYHLTGDGVVVPVVSYLARNLFEPVLQSQNKGASAAA